MDNTSLAHPTRTIFVDERLLEEIAELTGIEYRALSRAFVGKEKDLVLDVVKTAVAENPQATPEDWQNHVLTWAKENGSGEYRPGYWDGYELTYENNEYLRSIGHFWGASIHRAAESLPFSETEGKKREGRGIRMRRNPGYCYCCSFNCCFTSSGSVSFTSSGSSS